MKQRIHTAAAVQTNNNAAAYSVSIVPEKTGAAYAPHFLTNDSAGARATAANESASGPLSPQEVLTEDDAAAFLQVTPFALRKWRRTGYGPCFIRCGARLVRYTMSDLHSWLEQNTFASEAHEMSAKSADPTTPAK